MAKQLTLGTQTSTTGRSKVIRALLSAAVILAVLTLAVIGGRPAWNHLTERGQGRDAKLERIGIVFKMYVNQSKGERFPPLSPSHGKFYPDLEAFRVTGLEIPQDLTDYLAGKGEVPICYLGFMVKSEVMADVVLDEYEARGPGPLHEGDIQLTEPINVPDAGETTAIYQLREGIERFFITEIMDATASGRAQSHIPVLWEIPDPPKRSGGWVLYMDGHVEWKEYPGEFPMTERFIERVKKLTASREPK